MQQESGKGPRFANGAAYCVPDLTSHTLPPWRALLGRPDPLGSRLLQPVRGKIRCGWRTGGVSVSQIYCAPGGRASAGSARACRAHPPPCNLLMTVRGIVTVQFVRLRASRMALACARRRAPEKNPGTRRRTAARIVLGPSRSLRTSGRSDSRKRELVV